MDRNPDQSELSGLRCLIADDNEPIRTAVEEALGDAGAEIVGVAADGAQTLKLLHNCVADAIVLDLRLGDDDGIDVARRAAELAPHTAVVLYTSHADGAAVSDALAVGVRALVFKQASPASLLHALKEVAAGRTFVDRRLSQPPGRGGDTLP